MNKSENPIGVFDSGLGGLTVVRELIRQLPKEDIVYFGDTARVPYGTKSKASIVRFSKENARLLVKHKVKMIVVACNSSSSFALQSLKREFRVPVLGVVEPGARSAIEVSTKKKIGVIATTATVNSGSYRKSIKKLGSRVEVFEQACPLLVPLAEEGRLTGKAVEWIIRDYVRTLKKKKVDALILGCTHYPLHKKMIAKVMGPNVDLIDSAQAVAGEVKMKLVKEDLSSKRKRKGRLTCLLSDEPQQFKSIAKRFLGFNIRHIVRCNNV